MTMTGSVVDEQIKQVNNEIPCEPSACSIWGLNFLLFFLSDVRHGVGPLISIYLKGSLNWDAALIGLSLATVEFSSLLFQLPAGWLADTTHFKKTMIAVSCALIFACCFSILLFPLFAIVLIAQFLMGLSLALISPAIGSITLGLFGRQRLPQRAAKNEIWNHCGNVSTAMTAGLTAFFLGNDWVFYTVMIFSFCSLIALSLIKSNEIHHNIARELTPRLEGTNQSFKLTSKPAPIISLFKNKNIIIYNALLILYYIANGSQMALFGQKMTVLMPQYSSVFFASSMIIAEMTMIVVAFLMSRIVTKFGRKTFFLSAFCILPIRALLYITSNSPYSIMIQILDGMAAGILGVIGIVIISDLAQGTGRFNFLLGVAALCIAIGETISQIFGGMVAKAFGFNIAFVCLACVGFMGALYCAVLMPETKDE